MAGQAPEIHGLRLRVEPAPKVVAPFPLEVDKLRPSRSQAGAAHSQQITGLEPIARAEAGHARARKIAAIAPPARVQGRHITTALVRQQYGLTVRGLDQQPQTGPRGGHAVALRNGGGLAGHAFRVKDQRVAVHLVELRPGRESARPQGRQHVPAAARHPVRIVGRAEGNIAAVAGVAVAAVGPGGADLKGATHVCQTGKLKGNVVYRHRNCSSVQR